MGIQPTLGAQGVKAGGLTAIESKNNEPSEVDNGSGAGLVSRARIPLIRPLDLQVTPREGVRIGGMSKGLTPAIKHT